MRQEGNLGRMLVGERMGHQSDMRAAPDRGSQERPRGKAAWVPSWLKGGGGGGEKDKGV